MSKENLAQFGQFAKGAKVVKNRGSNCVIYTRVSTKEQADNNMSLETQKKACENYAEKNGYRIMGYFGGTYESAKTDERKHFMSMLAFVKKSKEKISTIVVYSVDRFSRSGANAIYITEQLKREGISVFAVTQPTDTTTASGSLQQNIQFIFSEYDNQLRREKCMAGTKEKLLAGVWCTSTPIGYDSIKRDGKRMLVLNDKGRLIKKAFMWKLKGLTNEAIAVRLTELGFKTHHQQVSRLLRNPFYCGLIVHSALEGEVIEGIQEKVITKEVFLAVNGVLAQNAQGYSIQSENDEVPLRRFVTCDKCGEYLTAYKSKKIQQYYYKCNTKGCKCNKRADHMHERLRKVIDSFTLNVNEDVEVVILQTMRAIYEERNKESMEQAASFERQLTEVERKIRRLEERYVMEEIDRDIFMRFREQFNEERRQITEHAAKSGNSISNLENCLKSALHYSRKLASTWAFGSYEDKQTLQKILFPRGISYNRENDDYRTSSVNNIFLLLARLSGDFDQKKVRGITFESNSAHSVEPTDKMSNPVIALFERLRKLKDKE